uniref:Apyrase n=1 Tax=Riptortus pedestris TaxID=329032 RepID=R4WDI7_RIPPE|nr:apyrase [Riptortus pedestris]
MGLSRAEEGEMFLSLKDWRKAVKTPPSYRIAKTAYKNKTQTVLAVSGVSLLLLYLYYSSGSEQKTTNNDVYHFSSENYRSGYSRWTYNTTYPLSQPLSVHDSLHFKVGLVSDMDHSSKSKLESNTWISYYLHGTLIWSPLAQTVSVKFDKNNFKTLKTKYSYDGRGMELSELVTFNGKLITFDDRSGIVYKIEDSTAYPWLLLTGGNGESKKGFKSEWATVKDEHLYVGSLGKEWTTPTGELVNHDPMWIKKISPAGEVESIPWEENYKTLRAKLGVYFPGYMLHESAVWSDIHKKWFFLPRRMSHESYNEDKDETQGTNLLLTCDENFKDIRVTEIGEVIPTHGFSSFKFIPGTKDEVIVALKSVEHLGKVATYIMAFTINGKIIMGETKIDDYKYEGFEFI